MTSDNYYGFRPKHSTVRCYSRQTVQYLELIISSKYCSHIRSEFVANFHQFITLLLVFVIDTALVTDATRCIIV